MEPDLTSVNGWICPTCGVWVRHWESHVCHESDEVYTFPPVSSDERILQALEQALKDLAKAIEFLVQALLEEE